MAEVGRPSELTEELLVKIKDCVLDGKNVLEMSEIIGIPYDTIMGWKKRNYDNFADILLSYKHERIIQKAECNLEAMLESSEDKIKSDLTKFTLETLNKGKYSKRNELSGPDGKDLLPTPILGGNK